MLLHHFVRFRYFLKKGDRHCLYLAHGKLSQCKSLKISLKAEMKKKYTIKDIAQLAGVSKGTVDRVLHKRGSVSKKAHEKIDRILREIEYQPNPIARNLKKNRTYRICVLIPDTEKDPYWIPAHRGVCEAAEEFKPFGILLEEFCYHPGCEESFIEKSHEAMASKPDAFLMAPLFQEASLAIMKKCKEAKVRVALFNNHIATLNNEIFIGQDLFQSGKIAGGLIHKMIGEDAQIAIIHINKEPHMQLKENGFKAYFQEKNVSISLLKSKTFQTSNVTEFQEDVCLFLKQHPNLAALFVTNSKVHTLLDIVEQVGDKCIIVGYDLLEKNVAYLKKDKIDFLIHQKIKSQAYLGITYFAEFFLFGKKPPTERLLPIDIVTAENVQYYYE